MAAIFISYAREDASVAKTFHDRLVVAGPNVFSWREQTKSSHMRVVNYLEECI